MPVVPFIFLLKFVFAPYTKWKTYVIFIEKRDKILETIEEIIRKNEKIWCYIVDNDGYANSEEAACCNSVRRAAFSEDGFMNEERSVQTDSGEFAPIALGRPAVQTLGGGGRCPGSPAGAGR